MANTVGGGGGVVVVPSPFLHPVLPARLTSKIPTQNLLDNFIEMGLNIKVTLSQAHSLFFVAVLFIQEIGPVEFHSSLTIPPVFLPHAGRV